LHVGPRQSRQGSKGKPPSIGPFLSGGLEDIVNFSSSTGQRTEGGFGRVSAVTRVSIAKGQGSPKRIEGRSEDATEGLPDLRKNPSGSTLGTQVLNQSLAEPFKDSISNSLPAPFEQRLSPLNPRLE